MNTTLEDDIRTALGELADATTVDPDARFGERTATVTEIRPTSRRWLMPAAAAFAGVVLIGGLMVATRDGGRPATTADQILPGTNTSDPSIPPDSTLPPIGAAPIADLDALFSTDDVDPALTSPNDDPTIVANAYLADRTRSQVLPGEYPIEITVEGDALSYTPESIGNQAVVRFSMQLPQDYSDGYLLLDQTAPFGEPKRWVVSGAETASFGLDSLRFENGTVSGSYTSEIGGLTEVTIYDISTGEALAPTLDVIPSEEIDLEDPARTEFPAALGRFKFSNVDTDAVAVRLWNTNAQAGGTPVALFAEGLVRRGENIDFEGAHPIADAARAADRPPTSFDGLRTDESKVIVDDTIQGSAVKVSIRRDDAARQAGQPAPYCVDIDFEGANGSACFSAEQVATQSIGFNVESADGTGGLVGSIVPDAAHSIETEDGLAIATIDNIWIDIVDAGSSRTYTISDPGGAAFAQLTVG